MGSMEQMGSADAASVREKQEELFVTDQMEAKTKALFVVGPPTVEQSVFMAEHFPNTDYGKKYGTNPDYLNFNIDGSLGDTTKLAETYRDYLEREEQLAPLEAEKQVLAMSLVPSVAKAPIALTLRQATKEGLPASDFPELERRLILFAVDPQNQDLIENFKYNVFDNHCTLIRTQLMYEKGLINDEVVEEKYGVKVTKKAIPRMVTPDYVRSVAGDFFPAEELDNVVRVCGAESEFNAHAFRSNNNKTIDSGLMQINTVHRDLVSSMGYEFDDIQEDDRACMAVAAAIFKRDGWRPWYGARKIGIA